MEFKAFCAIVVLAVSVSPALSHPQNVVTTVTTAPVSVPEYAYNITVTLPDDNHDRQEGKLWVTLEGNGFQHEIRLTPHSTPLRPGNSYSYYLPAPYPVERIESVLLQWRKKKFTNLLGSSSIHVKKVTFEPAYVTGALRTAATKRFCADQDPVDMTSEIKYKFWISCH